MKTQSNLELELLALAQLKQEYKDAIKNEAPFFMILELKQRLDLIQEQCFNDLSYAVLKKVG